MKIANSIAIGVEEEEFVLRPLIHYHNVEAFARIHVGSLCWSHQ